MARKQLVARVSPRAPGDLNPGMGPVWRHTWDAGTGRLLRR